MAPQFDPVALAHTNRFRRVSTLYPRLVAEAYGLDVVRAAGEDDLTVAAAVAAWERSQGIPPRDWVRIGAIERAELDWPDGPLPVL